MKTTYTLAKHGGAWWLIGDPEGPIGPYGTKGEAESDRRGLERTERYGHLPGFWSVDNSPAPVTGG